MYRHHVVPREQLYVPKESSFPIPLKYIDVVRQTKTYLDKWKRAVTMIYVTLIDGIEILCESCIGSTKFPHSEQASTLQTYKDRAVSRVVM